MAYEVKYFKPVYDMGCMSYHVSLHCSWLHSILCCVQMGSHTLNMATVVIILIEYNL